MSNKDKQGCNPNTVLPNELINAYKKTNFDVFTEPLFTLNIGVFSERLASMYNENSVETACFITAYNPFSKALTLEENEISQNRLMENLVKSGNQFFEGIGLAPTGEWDGESSFLVLGISKQEASDLGNEFKQNAVVWCGKNCVPQLLFLR